MSLSTQKIELINLINDYITFEEKKKRAHTTLSVSPADMVPIWCTPFCAVSTDRVSAE